MASQFNLDVTAAQISQISEELAVSELAAVLPARSDNKQFHVLCRYALHVKAMRMMPYRTTHEKLRRFQAIRDACTLPPDVGFFLVVEALEPFVERRMNGLARERPELVDICKRMRDIERACGRDEFWSRGDGPDDYEALGAEWEQVVDPIIADVFRDLQEVEIAELYLHNRAEFDCRREAGRQALSDILDVMQRHPNISWMYWIKFR